MNGNEWISPQTRLGCAGAAVLASALVLSSVLWLFAGLESPTASATPSQMLVSADARVEADRVRVR